MLIPQWLQNYPTGPLKGIVGGEFGNFIYHYHSLNELIYVNKNIAGLQVSANAVVYPLTSYIQHYLS